MAYDTSAGYKGNANSSSMFSGSSGSGTDWSAMFSNYMTGGTGDYSQMIGYVLQGLGQSSAQNDQLKDKKKDRDAAREMVRTQGDESRKTALYAAMLGDYYSQKKRSGTYKGLQNWKGYAATRGPGPISALNDMAAYESQNVVQDPGNAPPDPAAMYERRKGASWNHDESPYQINPETGALEQRPRG